MSTPPEGTPPVGIPPMGAPPMGTPALRPKPIRWTRAMLAALVVLALAVIAVVIALNSAGDDHGPAAVPTLQPGSGQAPDLIERGRQLATLGHCAGCHSQPGQPAYAGGAPLTTPFGAVYGGNLTPDPHTGLGLWTSQDFWRALHNGRSRDGRWLNPAFPYENFTHLSRSDSDALYAYFQTMPAVQRENRAHELRFPANTAWGLAIWRALFFRASPQPLIEQAIPGSVTSIDLQRGQALARGIAHCSACHGERNRWGALRDTADFSGGLLHGGRAWAPALFENGPTTNASTTAPSSWSVDDLRDYLKTGHSPSGAALGLMADVVVGSTQHARPEDLRDLSAWLLSRPAIARTATTSASTEAVPVAVLERGERLYGEHCAACHGSQGQGATVDGRRLYPALAGNPRVVRDPAVNLVRIILEGGFGPATAQHPRPFGMPPYAGVLQPEEIAAVATFLRRAWGHQAAPVTPLQVLQQR